MIAFNLGAQRNGENAEFIFVPLDSIKGELQGPVPIAQIVVKGKLSDYDFTDTYTEGNFYLLFLEYDEENWFNNLKQTTESVGFCSTVQEYKKNKEAYPGHVGDVSEMIRIAISTRKNTPNPYYALQILGEKEVARRIDLVLAKLN